MHCKEIREMISCMLDNELSGSESALVTEHVAGCPECMRVFEAFHAVSVSMEDLAEVPDGFTEDVMNRVNDMNSGTKKRKPRILRFAALAACLALVLLVGGRIITPYRGTSQHSNDTANYTKTEQKYSAQPDTGTDEADTVELTEEPQKGLFALFRNDGIMTASEEPENGGADSIADDAAATEQEYDAAVGEAASGSSEKLTDSASAPVPQPQAFSLSDLLNAAEAADPGLHTDAPQYTVTVQDAGGNDVTLELWLEEGRIYCKNPVSGEAWYAAIAPDQLMSMLTPAADVPKAVPPSDQPALTPQ